MNLEKWLLFVFFAIVALWLIWAVLPMSWWRAGNVRKAIAYRRRWGYWCDHTITDEVSAQGIYSAVPGMAWSAWQNTIAAPVRQRRWCGRCAKDEVRKPDPMQRDAQ